VDVAGELEAAGAVVCRTPEVMLQKLLDLAREKEA
jgi:hypothetical protein